MQRHFVLFLLLGSSSCDKESQDDSIPLNAGKITGSWKIVSESYSIGGPHIIKTIKNGGIYNFNLDGTFNYGQDTSPNFSGTFIFDEDILTIRYMQDGNNVTRKLKALFEENRAVLIPWDPICIEGCSATLQRID